MTFKDNDSYLPCPEHNMLFPVAVEYISIVGNKNRLLLYCSTYKPLSRHAISNLKKNLPSKLQTHDSDLM